MQSTITWISTDVELPDDSIVVLVALEKSDDPTWIGYYDSAEEAWLSVEGIRLITVTHWSEMPSVETV